MGNMKEFVQIGTYKRLTQSVGVVDAVNSDLSITKFATDRERFLVEYTAFSVKTAKATVEMCRVVYEAKKMLAKYEYLRFLHDIHHSSEDSTIRKYLAIGSLYDKLIQHTNLLPSSWTSIYEITQIPSDVFDALVSTGSSMANLKGAQIKLLKDTSKKSKAASTAIDATTATTAATTTTDTTAADLAHAQQATASLLERVAQTANAEANVASDDELYEIVIRFTQKPSDNAWWDLVEGIEDLDDKYNFDIDVIKTRPPFATTAQIESQA